MRESSASGFWVGWTLRPEESFRRSAAGANRQKPIGADLAILVAGFQQFVVEAIVLDLRALRRPDQCFMGVGEAPAAKIRHWIGFAPDNIVQDPKLLILQDRTGPKNIVVGADHENRRVPLHGSARAIEPCPGKIVVIGKARKLVPIVVDAIDEALVRPRETGFELQIIRRIGEDEIDAFRRQPGHLLDAIAFDDFIKGKRAGRRTGAEHGGAGRRNSSTHDFDLGFRAGRSGTLATHA